MTDAVLNVPIAISEELESPTRRALRRLFQRKGAVVGLIVIATFIMLALFAPWIVPYDPIATSWTLVRKPPSALHWFGHDDLGRDLGRDRAWGRRAVRTVVGLSRWLHRRPDQPHHRRHAGLPVPDPCHRAG